MGNDDLEKGAQGELDAIYGGINPGDNDDNNDLDDENLDDDLDNENPNGEDGEEDPENPEEKKDGEEEKHDENKSKRNKTEERFKKILSKKNDLANRVSELENKLAEEKFLKQYPQAEEFIEDIKKEMDSTPGLTREKAFIIVASEKGVNNRPKGIIGKPQGPKEQKPVKDMTADELFKVVSDGKVLEKVLNGD